MSRADELFIQNCRDILDNGRWDTDLQVRPRWEDTGERAHGQALRHREPLRPLRGIPHPHHTPHLLEERRGRAAVDMAEEVQQRP